MSSQPRIPRSDFGAPRRAGRRVSRGAVDVHFRMPVWLAVPLFAESRRRASPVSAIIRAAVAEHLDVARPIEDGDAGVN